MGASMRGTKRARGWAGAVAALGVLAALVAGCGSSGNNASESSSSSSAPGGATATTSAPKLLKVLVTNDDGVGADGLDAVVEGLRALPDTEVTVVAPLGNQSGTASNTTPGDLVVSDTTTKSGYQAKAVDGFPADTVIWAIDQKGIAFRPDLVVSGINLGANLGPFTELSGTVGAARAAASRGIPALAASQGIAEPTDFASGVKQVLAWVTANRDKVMATPAGATGLVVYNLNVPTCNPGSVRGQVNVPVAITTDGLSLTGATNCDSTATNPSDDVVAFNEGFAPLSELPATPATP